MISFEEVERIHLELSSACNAACQVCPRNADGGYTIPWLVQRTMTLADYKKIFTVETTKHLKSILMCGNYGDPIYCKDLPAILEYMMEINPSTRISIHTNGGMRSPEWWSDLAKSHTNLFVTFSIDGLEDTNHIYRRNVNWKRLMENVNSFIAAGGHAIWEFLIFKHNQHQIDTVKDIAEQMKFKTVRFKRPFGFEAIDNNYTHMRVLKENGELDYFIYPADDEVYKNKNFTDTEVDRYNENTSFPPDVYTAAFNNTVEHYNDIIAKESKLYEYMDGSEISCMTKNSKEIYIDSAGNVHPCCFLGIGSQNVSLAIDIMQYHMWIKDRMDTGELNATLHPLNEILDKNYFQPVEDSWSKTHAEGRMLCCTKMCSKNKSPKDKLYL
jgi:MoaA/NifB/PqqE/SkfB family radical SAM enzyme